LALLDSDYSLSHTIIINNRDVHKIPSNLSPHTERILFKPGAGSGICLMVILVDLSKNFSDAMNFPVIMNKYTTRAI
jgi:hypothetical protein